ncbi:unnamed protein product [Diplocarpon coronariae]
MLPEQEEVHHQIINFSFPRKDPEPQPDMATMTVPPPALSTTSSATTEAPPRPLHVDTKGNWTATQTAPLEPSTPTPLPAAALAPSTVTTHRPILRLKPFEATSPYEASVSSASSFSLKRRESIRSSRNEKTRDPAKRTKVDGFKETVFFALVLLPLSCWYTRGGKRLSALEEEDRAVRALPELQRPLPGEKAAFGNASAIECANVHPVRRESFSAAARSHSFAQAQRSTAHGRRNSFSHASTGHGRSNSMSQVPRGGHGRSNSFTQNPVGRTESFGRGRRDSWSGNRDLDRIEVADYDVDRGADFDALRLDASESPSEEPVAVAVPVPTEEEDAPPVEVEV